MLPDGFESARLILRPIAKGDAPAIFTGYAQDPLVVRFLTWRPHGAFSETEDYIARCMAAPPDKSRTYVLIGRGESQLLGAFELRRPKPFMLDFGYALARIYWGRGLMTEALAEVVDWAMRQELDLAHRRRMRCREPRLGPCHGKSRAARGRGFAALDHSPEYRLGTERLLQLRQDPLSFRDKKDYSAAWRAFAGPRCRRSAAASASASASVVSKRHTKRASVRLLR